MSEDLKEKLAEDGQSTSTDKEISIDKIRSLYDKLQKEELEKEKQEKLEYIKELFATSKKKTQSSGVRLTNLTKTDTRSYTTFDKEKLRTYMKNPLANASNLRNLSRYLYRMSSSYRRLISYNAEMIDLSYRRVIPKLNLTDELDAESAKTDYMNTIQYLNRINFNNEILKMLIIAWREDIACGIIYEDDKNEDFFILPLDNDYCKISGMNYDGSLNFAFDMTFFQKNTDLLEYYGEPFTSMYRAYESDSSNMRWQEIDPSISFCIKINTDDPVLPVPPYVALFSNIIDLCDLQNIQSVKDKLSIYKLIVAKMETLDGAEDVDEFKIDVDTALEYYSLLEEELPDFVGSCISPLPLDVINFDKDQTDDVNKLESATKNLFNTSGGAQVLNSSTLATSSAYEVGTIVDSEYAMSSILPQLQQWINRILKYRIGDNHSIVKFIDVTKYTVKQARKDCLEACQYGFNRVLEYNALCGISEYDSICMGYLENDILQIKSTMTPLQGASTISKEQAGGQEKDVDELTDGGEATRDGDKNNS